MNEFERRMLDIAQRDVDLRTVVNSLGRSALIEHFDYTARLFSVAAPAVVGVQQSTILAMQSDAWFVLQAISSCALYNETPYWFLDSGSVQVQITDVGAGNVLYAAPSSAGVLTATISRPQTGVPFLLPIPRLIPPNTSIKIDATQIGQTAQTLDGFFVSLIGSRVAQI